MNGWEEKKDKKKIVWFNSRFCCGGYGKRPVYLKEFLKEIAVETGVVFDEIYNGKMMYGIRELVKEGYFKSGDRLLVIHTGGVHFF
jgi:1-aminocyclopropane-1-carboxylate deaminase